jgi:hypothetical protein
MAPPRILIIIPDQWPRALLRAGLREVGYDAIGATDLRDALRYRTSEPGRGPVRLVIVEQEAVQGGDAPLLEPLRARHGDPPTVLLAHATHAPPPGAWAAVLRRPFAVGDVASLAARLVPLPPAARAPLDE